MELAIARPRSQCPCQSTRICWPDGTGADKCRRLEIQSGTLGDLGDRANVILMGASGAVGVNPQFVADDLVRQRFAIRSGAWTGAGQTQVERVDAQSFHAM